MWRMRLISGLFVRKELKSVPLHKAHRSPRGSGGSLSTAAGISLKSIVRFVP
jgi:hypothetical protein